MTEEEKYSYSGSSQSCETKGGVLGSGAKPEVEVKVKQYYLSEGGGGDPNQIRVKPDGQVQCPDGSTYKLQDIDVPLPPGTVQGAKSCGMKDVADSLGNIPAQHFPQETIDKIASTCKEKG